MHPQGEATITLSTGRHPITYELTDFVIFDERYSYLQTQPDVTCCTSTAITISAIHSCGPGRPSDLAWSTTVLATTPPRTTALDRSKFCAGRSCGF